MPNAYQNACASLSRADLAVRSAESTLHRARDLAARHPSAAADHAEWLAHAALLAALYARRLALADVARAKRVTQNGLMVF
jgi:hypothetical protein